MQLYWPTQLRRIKLLLYHLSCIMPWCKTLIRSNIAKQNSFEIFSIWITVRYWEKHDAKSILYLSQPQQNKIFCNIPVEMIFLWWNLHLKLLLCFQICLSNNIQFSFEMRNLLRGSKHLPLETSIVFASL